MDFKRFILNFHLRPYPVGIIQKLDMMQNRDLCFILYFSPKVDCISALEKDMIWSLKPMVTKMAFRVDVQANSTKVCISGKPVLSEKS